MNDILTFNYVDSDLNKYHFMCFSYKDTHWEIFITFSEDGYDRSYQISSKDLCSSSDSGPGWISDEARVYCKKYLNNLAFI